MFLSWHGFDVSTGECKGELGSLHWNNSPNTGGVIHTPEKGLYCSADPAIVAWQLQLLEETGIQAVFISWWGWGDTHLDGKMQPTADAHINKGIVALLDGIRENKSPFKVALIAEPFTLTQAGIDPNELTQAQKPSVLDWLWENYYGNPKYADLMYSWQGKPLLIAFDPMSLSADSRYTLRDWTGRKRDAEAVSEGWQWFFAPPQDVIEGMSDDGIAFVYPRFDEYSAKQRGQTTSPGIRVESILSSRRASTRNSGRSSPTIARR